MSRGQKIPRLARVFVRFVEKYAPGVRSPRVDVLGNGCLRHDRYSAWSAQTMEGVLLPISPPVLLTPNTLFHANCDLEPCNREGPPRNQPHVWRGGGGGGGGRTQHYHPQSMAGGVPGSRGSASTAGVHHDGHGPGGGGGGVGGHMHHHHHHGGGGGGRDLGGSGGRHEEMLPPHRHPVVSRALSDDSGR